MKPYLLFFVLFFSLKSTAAVTEWFDFTLEQGHVFLPVKIAGVDSKVMLDSGAQVNSINPAFISKNNLDLDKGRSIKIQGVYGVEKRSTYNNVKLEMFGTEFELDDLVEVNLGHHSKGMLMGSGFFKNFIVQLDYPSQKMRLLTRDVVNMREISNVQTAVQRGSRMPLARIEIDGTPLWLIIDTGNSGSILIERRAASRAGLLEKVEGASTSFGANSSGVNEYATANVVKFGPFEIGDVQVSFPAEGEKTYLGSQYKATGSRLGGKKVVGLIGYDLLKDFVVSLEYASAKMHIYLPDA